MFLSLKSNNKLAPDHLRFYEISTTFHADCTSSASCDHF